MSDQRSGKPPGADRPALGQCPFCGRDDLPIRVQDAEVYRFLGWVCPSCDAMGIVGMLPDQPEPGEERQ